MSNSYPNSETRGATILVVGMHRSGTSAICRLLDSAGIDFGNNLIPAGDDNPLGFWEDREFIRLNELVMGGHDAWFQVTLPPLETSEQWQKEASVFLESRHKQCPTDSAGVGLKDPRICRTLPQWLPLIHNPRILFTVRNPLAVAYSLNRRDGFSVTYGLALWFVYNYESLKTLQTNNVYFCLVDYDRLMGGDPHEVDRISAFLGISGLDQSLLDQTLHHQKFKIADFNQEKYLESVVSRFWKIISSDWAEFESFKSDYESVCAFYKPFLDKSVEFKRLQAYANHLESDIKTLNKNLCQVNRLNQTILRSRSWRWMAPFRYVRRKLAAGVKKAILAAKWVASYSIRKIHPMQGRMIASSRQNASALQSMVDNRSLEKFWNPFPSVPAGKLPTIGLSVVLYNNGRWLKSFMDSLVAQHYPLDRIQLVFIDNSSTDDTSKTLEEIQEAYQERFGSLLVDRRPNNGFGSGHDYAIRLLDADYVLVSNVDLEFQKHSIMTAVAAALTDQGVASWEFRQSPYEHPKYVDPVTLHVNWSSHACILLDRKAYLAVGGYEKSIFMYGEDVELSYRFRRAGYHLKYVPRAIVFHHTYGFEGEIKPLQFSGSVAANLLIRCRYGDWLDVFVGYLLISVLAVRGAGFSGSRRMIWRTLLGNLTKSLVFLSTRRKSDVAFPFRGFDYDLCREGAFWESDRNIIDRGEDMPTVTVITRTVEGREALLGQAIMSVMNQTYPDVEHIIAEDGGHSVRSMCDRVNELSPERYRIRHLECPKEGRSHAANRALDAANGEYVVILDDDDLLFPDHIETLITEVIRTKCDAAYSLAWDTPVKFIDKSRGRYSEHAHVTLPLFYQEFDRKVLFERNFLPIQSVLFKRSLAGSLVRFDEDLDHLEDWVFWKRLSKGADFRFVAKTTSMYKTPSSAGENFRRRKALDAVYAAASERPND